MTDHRIRYFAVGGLCAVLHNFIVIGGDAVGLHYLVTTLISYLVSCGVGYSLHSLFTFYRGLSWHKFVLYCAAMSANYPLSALLMFILVDRFELRVSVASPAATLVLILWNYAAARWAIRSPWASAKRSDE